MPKRPKDIGSLWMGANQKFIHGPRFADPNKFEQLFFRSKNATIPRYLYGLKKGKINIQTVVRPVYPEELRTINVLAVWWNSQFIFPAFRITPFNTFNKQRFVFYTFAFSKRRKNKFVAGIKKIYNYRIRTRTVSGIIIYLIYRRRKNGKAT